MKKTIIFTLLALLVSTYACKKEENEELNKEHPYGDDVIGLNVSEYSQLKVGNYWIYQEYDMDSTGMVATPTTVFDSCYIADTMLIRGHVYYKITAPDFTTHLNNLFIRDSADCIVTNTGRVEFSLQNFSTPLYMYNQIIPPSDTVCTIITKMTDSNSPVVVPAGNFLTMNSQMNFLMHAPFDMAGKNRIAHRKFAYKVGLVLTTKPFFASISSYKELRLVRYHLN